jgi:crotonobetainyl-CoA:carnitine CoA-transferase CaiB-like acyl-CoA transferase
LNILPIFAPLYRHFMQTINFPFKSLKVVEFASVLAGPAVGLFFAELGAEVIKIENSATGGDMTRGWKLPQELASSPTSAYFFSVNWGKKHLFLDLKQPADRQTALDIAAQADVVISNFKPSSAAKMGVDAAALREVNPRLIYATIHSFADPEDESPAFDMVLQAEAGFLYMNGEPGRPPVKMPVALIDLLAAHQLKEAILIGLLQRERTGKGCEVSVSLLESALASLVNQASNYLNTGYIPQPMGTQHPNIAPYGDVFTTADGQPIVLAVGTERQFERLCTVLHIPDLTQDPDFQNNGLRVQHRGRLVDELAKAIALFSLDQLLPALKKNGVPAARIRNMQEVMEMPAAQEMVLEEVLEDGTVSKRMMGNAFRMKE